MKAFNKYYRISRYTISRCLRYGFNERVVYETVLSKPFCKECGDQFWGRKGTIYCSETCINKATNRRAAERIRPLKSDLEAMKKAYKNLNKMLGENQRVRVTKRKFKIC